MTDKSMTEFHPRRTIKEQPLAGGAPEVSQVIAHDRLLERHANALGHDNAHLPKEIALEVTAVAGDVVVSGAMGPISHLTPNAAVVTSDRLLARARDAGRQAPTPSSAQQSGVRTDHAGRATGDKKAHSTLIANLDESAAERAR